VTRRLPLTSLLIVINAGLLLLAAGGVALFARGLLQQLADEQALARVSDAGTVARQLVLRAEDDALVSAQLLAERPTLQRLAAAGDGAALAAFLAQFQQTAHLDATAVVVDGRVLAGSGDTDLRLQIAPLGADAPSGENAGSALSASGSIRAWARVVGQPGTLVAVGVLLDQDFMAELSAEVGVPVTLISDADAPGAPDTERRRLWREALSAPVARRLSDEGRYVAAVPLVDKDGRPIALIQTELPGDAIAGSLADLTRALGLLTLGVALAAALLTLALGRRLTRPLAALTTAAGRIGEGDMATPVPHAPGAELDTLAATLDDMRRRLLHTMAELQRREAEAEALVNGIVEGVFSVDRERRVRYLNPQAAALLGVRVEDAVGRFCGDVLHPLAIDGVRPCDDQCPIVHARFRGDTRAVEHLQPAGAPARTVVITSAAPAGDQQVQVLRDETELEATRRLRDNVLANISHEFRTPLSAQLASIELLQDQLPELSVEQVGQLVASLQRGTLRLTQLIDNLLESARIEAGRDTLRRAPVALDQVVEDALALVNPLLQLRGQVVEVDLPYPLPAVAGDAPRLTQVFVNLLANANKYAPPGSTIRVGGAAGAASVTLWVEDEGPGLPEPIDPALFTRFVRASGEEPEQSGAGLGLWIVKSIVERHGGAVAASNTGAGARLSVTLPAA
jgi:signal transduction histidine kinase